MINKVRPSPPPPRGRGRGRFVNRVGGCGRRAAAFSHQWRHLDMRQPVWGSGACKDTPDTPPVSKVKERKKKKGTRVVQTRDLTINFPVFKMVTKSLHIQTETCGINFCIFRRKHKNCLSRFISSPAHDVSPSGRPTGGPRPRK